MMHHSGVTRREEVFVCFSDVMPRFPPPPRLRRGHELKGAPSFRGGGKRGIQYTAASQ
jgi:hypothetical protein